MSFDCLVVGTGVAGLSAAIRASRGGASVLVIAKDAFRETNTEYAQGGVAAVTRPDDSFRDHFRDTVSVAQGLADESRVEILVREGPERVGELVDWGGNFDRTDGELALAMEGGHSRPRILRAGGDATGREFQALLTRVARRCDSITFAEHTFLVDLLTESDEVLGALLWDSANGFRVVWTGAVVLATGGIGQIYRETTNPRVATGDGLAVAFRAGAPLQDLEFVQFHPTTLYVAGAARNLISEAVRGEGAYLRDGTGERFMPHYHPDAELAPRDVVSRSILEQMRKTGDTNAYLDLTHLGGDAMKVRFPQLAKLTESFGLDIGTDLVPVHPSAHYSIGGLAIDDFGRTPLRGLYACGEAAASGVHGANRLASNSLLECLVFGERAGRVAVDDAAPVRRVPLSTFANAEEEEGPPHRVEWSDVLNSIQALMWRSVGIEREGERLSTALHKLTFWSQYVAKYSFPSPSGWEAQNVLTVAYLVAEGAYRREETRGVHCRTDFPQRDDPNYTTRIRTRRLATGEIVFDDAPLGRAASAELSGDGPETHQR